MAKKKTLTANSKETGEQKFVRLANQRVNQAIKRLRLLSNLSGASYKSSPEQRGKILDTLESEIERVRSSFAGKETGTEKFSL